ncbi:MAG: protein kinase [Acidobacteriia bacterium]|nr:protein kinase [Terriglobia bacterium]
MKQQVGRYQVLEKLGKGAMGVVYLAEDPLLKRQVAIKTVELAIDDLSKRQFLRERLLRDARAAAGLSHPNIVSVYDVLEEGDCGYLVLEYIAGENLSVRLARTPRPDTAFTTRVLREMASALDYTHARGVIHRDIKPSNVMLDAAGTAKIMDFGVARIADARTSTPTGMIMGTLEYMAPEQIKGEPVDGRADQFSLAAVAYEMLTGSTLFGEQTFHTLAYKIVNEMPTPPRTHNPGLPPGVDEVLGRALRKPPVERFPTCGAFVAALDRAFTGEVPATGQTTQVMFVPPSVPTVATARPVVPPVPVPPAPVAPPPMAPVPAAPPPAPPAPVATVSARRGALIGIAGTLAAVALGAALMLWKPWANTVAPIPAQPPPTAGQVDNPGSGPPQLPHAEPPSHAAAPKPKPSSAATEPPKTAEPKSAASQPPRSPQPTPPEPALPEPDPAEASFPQPALAAFREGQSLIKADRYPAAIQAFSKAIELRPEFLRAYFARGAAYLHQNRAAEAFADYSELLRRNPRNAIALAQRGICHARLHDEEAAMADFNRALELRADIPGALNGRGLIFLHRKQYQMALRELTEAIRLSPDYAQAYLNRGRTWQALGNQSAAQSDLAKAQELNARQRE